MAAFYWTPPSAEALAKAGLRFRPSLFKRPAVEVWADLAPAFDLFARNHTQWRVGAGGPVGLDYNALYSDMDRRGVDLAQQDEIMGTLRSIERAALEFLHKS
ncbi:hypothetical protein AXYL_04017 [Achromobacter xylosoxidans A8]|uniref:Phage protein n=1 Tax=Achromobacter xylosoxidans (strain A8) TaxID=762376 RepID=E3HSM0_ACHXA|nr:DUF1799 domain-containing protein [Achromobacter xylosoxidans]ADP17337.1 hypothetical protein AXYL_04017 [Achromobacter xylosoxidans A8]